MATYYICRGSTTYHMAAHCGNTKTPRLLSTEEIADLLQKPGTTPCLKCAVPTLVAAFVVSLEGRAPTPSDLLFFVVMRCPSDAVDKHLALAGFA